MASGPDRTAAQVAAEFRERRAAERLRALERATVPNLSGAALSASPLDQDPRIPITPPAPPAGEAEVVLVAADHAFAPSGTFALWAAVESPPARQGFPGLALPSAEVPLTFQGVYTVTVDVDWYGAPGGVVEVWTGGSRAEVLPSGPRLVRDVQVVAETRLVPVRVSLRHGGTAAVRASVRATVRLGQRMVPDVGDQPDAETTPDVLPAPGAPGVVAGNTLDNAYLDVTWGAVSGAAGYEVLATRPDGVFVSATVGMTEDEEPPTEARVERLLPDTEYRVAVRALGLGGAHGELSPETTVTTPQDQTVPNKVTGLRATGAMGGTAFLSWDESPELDVAFGAGRYEWRIDNGTPTSTQGTIAAATGLAPGTYAATVRAVDASGNEGPWSDPAEFTISDVTVDDILEDGAILARHLADEAVEARHLVDSVIGPDQLADFAVLREKLADFAVGPSQLADEAVETVKLANNAVDELKLATGAVSDRALADRAVLPDKLADLAVELRHMSAGSVDTDQLVDEAIEEGKLKAAAVSARALADGSVLTDKLADLAVKQEKLADRAVTSRVLGDGAVDLSKFSTGLRPVQLLGSLPALPNPDYPPGAVASYNGKLYRVVGTTWSAAVPTSDLTGTIPSGLLEDGAVTLAKFAAGLRPITTLSSRPSLPSATYPVGSVISQGGKLWRNVGNVWTASVPATDLTGKLAGTQIADDAIGETHIAEDSISTPMLQANVVKAANIDVANLAADDAFIDDLVVRHIEAGAVDTDQLAANAVTVAKMDVGELAAHDAFITDLASQNAFIDALVVTHVAAGAIDTEQLAAGAVDAAKVDVEDLLASSAFIDNLTVNAAQIASVYGSVIEADWLSGGKLLVGGTGTSYASTAHDPTTKASSTELADVSSVASAAKNTADAAEKGIHKGTSAPPDTSRLWLKTNVTPNVLYRHNGSTWVKATPTEASEVGATTQTWVNTQYSGTKSRVASWQHGNDQTFIDGGRIYADSVKALQIDTEDLAADTGFISTLISEDAFIQNLVVENVAAGVIDTTHINSTEGINASVINADWLVGGKLLIGGTATEYADAAHDPTKKATTQALQDVSAVANAAEKSIHKGTSAPADTSRLWLDTSNASLHVLKRHNGSTWVKATPTAAAEVGAPTTAQHNAVSATAAAAKNTADAAEVAVHRGSSAPTGTGATSRLWLDTSATPNVLKRHNGSTWVKATPTQASEVGATTESWVNTQYQATRTRVTDWTRTGTTLIDGGAIYADSVKAAQIDADDLAANTAWVRKLVVGQTAFINELVGSSAFLDNLTVKNIAADTIDTQHINSTLGINASVINADWLSGGKLLIGANNTEYAAGYDPTTKATPQDVYLASSMITNPSRTESLGEWSHSSAHLVHEDFFGSIIPMIRTNTSGDTQYRSERFDVEPTKAYEVSLWVKDTQQISGTQFYFGLDTFNTPANVSSSRGSWSSRVSPSTGAVSAPSSNNYFFNTSSNYDGEWRQHIAYILPYGTDGTDTIGLGLNVSSNVILEPGARSALIRFLNWNNASGGPRDVFVAHPTVREVSMDQVRSLRASAQEMANSAVAPANERIQLWEYPGTTLINGGSIYADSVTANEIDTVDLAADTVLAENLAANTAFIDQLQVTGLDASVIKAGTIDASRIVLTAGQVGAEAAVHKGSTAPADTSRLWLQTNVTPNVLHRHNGSTWVKATPTAAGEVGAPTVSQHNSVSATATAAKNTADAAEKGIHRGTSAPSDVSRLWLDTYSNPNILKRYNGSTWVKATPTEAAEVGATTQAWVNGQYSGTKSRVASWQWPEDTTYINGGTIGTDTILANSIHAGSLAGDNAFIGQLNANEAFVGLLAANTVLSENLEVQYANIKNVAISNADIISLNANKLTSATLTSTTITLGTGGIFRAGTASDGVELNNSGIKVNRSGDTVIDLPTTGNVELGGTLDLSGTLMVGGAINVGSGSNLVRLGVDLVAKAPSITIGDVANPDVRLMAGASTFKGTITASTITASSTIEGANITGTFTFPQTPGSSYAGSPGSIATSYSYAGAVGDQWVTSIYGQGRNSSSRPSIIGYSEGTGNTYWHIGRNGSAIMSVANEAVYVNNPLTVSSDISSTNGNISTVNGRFWAGGSGTSTSDMTSRAVLSGSGYLILRRGNNTSLYIGRTGTAGVAVQFQYLSSGNNSGNIHVGTTTSYNTSSDYRIKTNIQPLAVEVAVDRIRRTRPVTFDWTLDGWDDDGLGYIAHELQEVAPFAVTGEKDAVDENGDPVYQGVDAAKLVPDLHRTVQYLLDEIDILRERLEELETAA